MAKTLILESSKSLSPEAGIVAATEGKNHPITPHDSETNRERALREHRPAAWANSVTARKGKSLSVEHRAKLGASKVGRVQSKRKVSLWAIAEDALLGLSTTASGIKQNVAQGAIYQGRRRLGFAGGWPGVYRHGEVLTGSHIKRLAADTGATDKEIAAFVGFGYFAFANRITKTLNRPLSSANPGDPKSLHRGRQLNAALDRLVDSCCYYTSQSRSGGRTRNFLASEMTAIPKKYESLVACFGEMGGFLRQNPESRTVDGALLWLCTEAKKEVGAVKRGENPPRDFQTLLFMGNSFKKFLVSNPDVLESAGVADDGFRPSTIAQEVLAIDFGAAPGRIKALLNGELEALDPRTLRSLLTVLVSKEAPAKHVPFGHAPVKQRTRNVSERTKEKGKFCIDIQNEIRRIRNLWSVGGRTIVEIELAHPDLAVWKVRGTLGEEDREQFNHPKRWEAVSGYARVVLAKYFGCSPVTVRDWMKAYRAHSRKNPS